ncbi:hypothetical protein Ocepr_0667 [Oceanithermus profundus DSM 14977]|uniref:LPS-assembly protein LptD n=1 Tax=Oceanithermus profundus (strain DSM 14977 / NBRC 100410 / VKM B-2274 / 506) TaxID=670487 RepID=E4U835_OCEP5|nr:hypothetical protein [Oceanithermus profundus]ADR36125.1 hypothetical protein Ocepr_0667 [Oceanithermus profundus DSM 14977]
MNPRRAFLGLFLAAGLAWAGPCADADVVLELERPPAVLGGAQFELDGDVLTFSEGACLEAGGAAMTAARIVYDRAAGALRAEAVSGSFAGWAFRAPRLVGEGEALVLEAAVFERGDAVVRAERARFAGGRLALEALDARTPRYRFRAARGRLEGEVFVAEEVRSTPCKCGSALELAARRAVFRFQEDELVLQQGTFRLYGAAVARPERLRLELDRPLDLRFPLRLSYGAGWNFGVEGLPLPAADEAFGRWSTRLTLLAEGVGGAPAVGKTEAVRFAVEHASAGRTLRFGLRPARTWDGAAWRTRVEPDVRLNDGPLDFRIGWSPGLDRSVAAFTLSRSFDLGLLQLRPFARLAHEEQTGLAAGAGGRLVAADRRFGALQLRLELPYQLALYPDAAPYVWGGGRAELRYGEAARLWAEAYGVRGRPRYGYEARTAREGAGFEAGRALRASASYRRAVRYDLAAGAVAREDRTFAVRLDYAAAWGTLAAGWRYEQRRDGAGAPLGGDARWTLAAARAEGELELAWRRGWDTAWSPAYSELRLAYRPAAPDCAGGWTLAPSLGWDLLRGRVSRAGLELTLNDCCFAWTLGYQGVFAPQLPGEAAGHQLRFGVRLR